jgi:glycosyltransferase involved in cell wall biosynthesis
VRVLFVVRPDASTRFGGDTVLARQTLEAVRERGVEADFVETAEPQAHGYDVAHVFNVGQPEVCSRQMRACAAAGAPIALSPVWLDLTEYFGRAQAQERAFSRSTTASAAIGALRRISRSSDLKLLKAVDRKMLAERHSQQSECLRAARVLLPNSAIEARDCLVKLGVRERPVVIAPIAADLDPALAWQEQRSGLLAVGRVETRKNQTGLLFALRDEPYSIDIVGEAYDAVLVKVCQRFCPRATFHGRLPRQQVLERLGRAEVHALVSWCETAGIASLEAAAAGAKIVVSDRGAEVEYFGDDAEYADPADSESIRAAVRRAFARPPRFRGDSLDCRIRRTTWRHSAQEVLRAYHIALGQREN